MQKAGQYSVQINSSPAVFVERPETVRRPDGQEHRRGRRQRPVSQLIVGLIFPDFGYWGCMNELRTETRFGRCAL